MDKEKIAQRIIDQKKAGKEKEALKTLKLARGIIGDNAYFFLLDRITSNTLLKAKNILGGKIKKKKNPSTADRSNEETLCSDSEETR